MKNDPIQYDRDLFRQEQSPWFKSRLSWRLLVGVLLFSSVITLLSTGLQLYLEYQRDLREVDDQIGIVHVAHLESLTTSLWKLDNQQLATEMDNVVQLKDIVGVRIHSDGQVVFRAGRPLASDESFTSQRFPMIYDDGRNHSDLGEMEIIASLNSVQQQLIDRVLVIFGTQSLKTFLVSAFILLFVHSLISRHLLQIAEKAKEIHQGNADELLSLNRHENKAPDELDVVVSALNEMIRKSREWQTELEETVQKRTASLQQSEKASTRLGRIVEQSVNEVYVFDTKTLQFIQVNHGARANLGYSIEELQCLTPIDIKPEITLETFNETIQPLRDGDKDVIIFETIHQRKDGTLYDVEVHLQLISEETSQVFVAIIQDVTDRKRIETYQRESESRLQQLLDLSKDAPNLSEKQLLERSLDIAVSVTGSKIGYLHLVNDDQETLTLSTWNDAAMELCTAAYDSHYPICEAGIWADAIRNRHPVVHNDYQAITDKPGYPEGHFPVIRHMSAPVLDSGQISLIVGVGNKETDYDHYDVTMLQAVANDIEKIVMRRRAEVSHQLARLEADKANKTKSDFLANMSHDLRTPLNAIIGFSQMIETQTFGPIGDPHYEEYVADIHNSGDLLISLIDDILDISKIEAGKYTLDEATLDVVSLIQRSVKMVSKSAEKRKLQLATNIEPNIPMLRGDEKSITQILNNLLSNAIKFTPEDGKVLISTKMNGEGALNIIVGDTGIGMNKHDINRALEPFEQVESAHTRKHEGTGLGLFLSLNLMKLHGGDFEINSKTNKGTTVKLTFPSERVVSEG